MRNDVLIDSFNVKLRTYVVGAGTGSGANTEDFMRFLNLAASVTVLSGIVALTPTAGFAQAANLSECVQMQTQVKTALGTNAQSPYYQDAVKQQGYGRDFCTNGFYQNGVAHYEQALKLLGNNKS
jgi:hypothetical protein